MPLSFLFHCSKKLACSELPLNEMSEYNPSIHPEVINVYNFLTTITKHSLCRSFEECNINCNEGLNNPLVILEWGLLGKGVEFCFGKYQFSSVAQSCSILCKPMDCSMPGLPVHHQLLDLLKLKSIESMMPSNHLILCHPLPL